MQLREHADRTTLHIRGPVRLGEVPDLLEHARAASARGLGVEVVLGEAEHMHTAAWQVLMALEIDMQKQGQPFVVSQIPEPAQAMLEFLELRRWLGRQEGEL
jgi:ABC-type transporter Mla MlaB component